MRILVYGLSNGHGGVESIVVSMMQRLDCQFDILLSPGECAYADMLPADRCRLLRITPWGSNPLRFARELRGILHEWQYDYVWINGALLCNGTVIRQVRRHSNARVIMHTHGSSFEEGNPVKRCVLLALHYMERPRLLPLIDLPCCCSMKSARWVYGDRFVDTHEVHFVKNGINFADYQFAPSRRTACRRSLGIDDDTLLLFHAGRLTPVKNQTKVLDTLRAVLATGRKARLAIAGTGELEQMLRTYAGQAGVAGSVDFLGLRSDVAELMQAADVFLLPSLHEGFPVTMAEAQAAGLHLVVSDSISRETNITGTVDYLPIEVGASVWAEAATAFPDDKRRQASTVVRDTGWDIAAVARNFKSLLDNAQTNSRQ